MDVHSLPDDPALLKAMLLDAQGECECVQARHQEVVTQHQEVVRQYEETVQSQQKTIQQHEQHIAQLLRRLYGPRQERIDPNQLTLFDREELEALVAESEDDTRDPDQGERKAKKHRRGHGRGQLPEDWPRETILYELSEEQRRCPDCGELRQEIGRETSEQAEFTPAQWKVLVHERVKYACRHCGEHVAIAAKPPQPIEKGLPGPGLLAHVTLGKFGDHLPLYRHEDIFSRYGWNVRRSTLNGWIAGVTDLVEPLYLRMRELILESMKIHTDDTPVKLLDPTLGHARQARFWGYLGDQRHPYVVYDFTPNHKRDGPVKFLDGFEGYLQADSYSGYDGIFLDSKGKILEVACWSHCRRYWWEAKTADSRRVHQAVSYIARLYQLEGRFAERTDEARGSLRREHALPILEEFRAWLDREAAHVLPKSAIGKAFTYTLNQWDALCRYTRHGELAIDNNAAERAMKPVALGRKNWLFVASENGGRRAAILFSLIASCKVNHVEPFAYLRDIFTRLPSLDGSPASLAPLLPDRWLAANPQHRWEIADRRKAERHPAK